MPVPATFSPESSSLSSLPSAITAHEDTVRNVQKKLANYQRTRENDFTITILESFVKYLPQDGMQNISDDILGCNSDGELLKLATHLLTSVLVPMRAHGKTPIATPSPRFGAESIVEEIASELVESSSCNDQAWLKKACLHRDDNRCVISGIYDNNEAKKNLSLDERRKIATGFTEVAHIIPFSLGSFSETERWDTAKIWDAMYRCFPSIRSRLNFSPSTINDTYNAITMTSELHSAFEEFVLTFKPTGNDNVYRLRTYPDFPTISNRDLPQDGIVTITAHSPHRLPSASLFEAHAAIAEILHMSGMGEHIESILRERQLIRCFTPDGSTNVASLIMVF